MSSTIELARLAIAGLTAKDRTVLLREIQPADVQPSEQRLVRRKEAARLLAVSRRTVDNYSLNGILPKVKLPGHTRALGYRLADIHRLMGGVK